MASPSHCRTQTAATWSVATRARWHNPSDRTRLRPTTRRATTSTTSVARACARATPLPSRARQQAPVRAHAGHSAQTRHARRQTGSIRATKRERDRRIAPPHLAPRPQVGPTV